MPNYRKRGHDIQIVWLHHDLTLLDHVKKDRWGKEQNVYIVGHVGDALIIETTATEQRFFFLAEEEVREQFEEDGGGEDVYYERTAPPRRRSSEPRSPYKMPSTPPPPPPRQFSGITIDPNDLPDMITIPNGARKADV